MPLDSLHDVREEPLALRNEAVLPHLVGDKTDEVGREQDLFDRARVRETWRWDLEALDEALEHILVEMLDILQQPDLLLGGVIVDVGEAIRAAVAWNAFLAVVRDGDRTRVGGLTLLRHHHKLVHRCSVVRGADSVYASRAMSTLMATSIDGGDTIRGAVGAWRICQSQVGSKCRREWRLVGASA